MMALTGALEPLFDRVRQALERWDVSGARKEAEKARALATSSGDTARVALADVLLARVALLTCESPSAVLLPASKAPGGDAEVVLVARERFLAELALATNAAAPQTPTPSLSMGISQDRAAAAALAGLLWYERSERPPASGGLHRSGLADAGDGWSHLVAALDNEWSGGSGHGAVERALTAAKETGSLALSSAALRLRLAQCVRRGAEQEAAATRRSLRELVETWALTLSTTDATSALARPDRARLRMSEASTGASVSLLTETASLLAQERDTTRLVEIALDAAISITGAERGVLLLAKAPGQHHVAASRYVDSAAEANGLFGLSSTIAERALKNSDIIASNDVRSDPRFGDCASIALEVTSVLCVPIHARGDIEGAIYLDRRSRGRPFAADGIASSRALGSMLAAALLNARVISALETRGRELEAAREELALSLETRTAERDDVKRRLSRVEERMPAGAGAIVGGSAVMTKLRRSIEIVAASDAPVLVVGETGSGKELVARALHGASARRDRPFVALNCGALSENLLAAELFGAVRGAYTGASVTRAGLFVAAHQGTLFLDEVGDMPASMQTALLRVLETSEIRAVGSNDQRKVNVRVIAASHRDLVELVQQGKFRDDLRYRLDVVRVEIPPLRERLEDLPALCEYLLREVRRQYDLPERRLSAGALEALHSRRWHGNVRELRHVLASAALTSAGSAILPSDLPEERSAEPLSSADPFTLLAQKDGDGHALRGESIRRALHATGGHRGRAAKILGISRATLYRYCEAHSVELDSIPTRADPESRD